MKLWKKVLLYSSVGIVLLIFTIVAVIIFYFKQLQKEEKVAIEEYFETEYGDTDYVIDNMYNDILVTGYVAEVSSPSSPDTYFEIMNATANGVDDTYEEDVLSGNNTLDRIEDAYDQLVNETIDKNNVDFYYESIWGRYYSSRDNTDELFINPQELEIDKEYDIKDLGAQHGEIDIYAHDENIEYETVEHIMLQVKEILDKADIPFVKMSATLREPLDEDDNPVGHDRLEFYGVPYEEIDKDSLLQYLEDNDDTDN